MFTYRINGTKSVKYNESILRQNFPPNFITKVQQLHKTKLMNENGVFERLKETLELVVAKVIIGVP